MHKLNSSLNIQGENIGEYPEVKSGPPPYHVFTKLGDYFVFDTSGCRFYKIDELTYKLLQLCLGLSIEEAEEKLLKDGIFTSEAIKGVSEEIKLLSGNGLFDVPDYSISDEQIEKDLTRVYTRGFNGIELALAESCNLACTYCYCSTSRDIPEKGLMPEEIAHQSVRWLFDVAKNAKAKKINITFFGGEPLLNKPVIRSIIEYSQALGKKHGKKVTYSMTTNATLLDDEFLTFIKKNNISVMVSLDGPRKIHDIQCPTRNGKGSYNMATAGAKRLLTLRSADVRCTMTHPMPDLKELIDFFDDFGFIRSIIGPTTSSAGISNPFEFTEKDFIHFAEQEEALIPWMLEKLTSGEKLKYTPFDKIIERMKNCSSKTNTTKCGACCNCTYVGSDGALFPCHRFGGMKEWQLGNISNEPDYERYKKFWSDYRKSLTYSCESCWAWHICKGPCPWEVARADGTFDHVIKFCDFKKARIESAAYIYAWKQEHLPAEPDRTTENAKKHSNINK